MPWLEVSLTVDGEMAEAVAEVLSRYLPGGVVMESTAIADETEGAGRPVGPLRVCGYLPVDERMEATRQRIEEALYFLGRIHPLPQPVFTPLQETNWAEAWKQHYRPIPIGRRLRIVPAWISPPDDGRITIHIDPGMAFGTGTHPTTQLCLEMLEAHTPQGGDVLDIGCGSGILSIAALRLGAGRACGVDTDPDAVAAAVENARRNGVAEAAFFAVGSLERVRAADFPVQRAPLVVANILAHILIRLLDDGMAETIAPGGRLLLSGILEEQRPRMEAALQRHSLRVVEQRQIEDWIAMAVEPQP